MWQSCQMREGCTSVTQSVVPSGTRIRSRQFLTLLAVSFSKPVVHQVTSEYQKMEFRYVARLSFKIGYKCSMNRVWAFVNEIQEVPVSFLSLS
jgi:hypothetical protein